ncbi:hypothetical protein OAE69_01505 [Gammaproteobacteria bacterium]|nr:hypothetical protein [Gammaproteobacteria bacterium]
MTDIIDRLLNEDTATRYQDWESDYKSKFPQRDISLVKNPIQEIITNLRSGNKSFVVYGEPQSGKTEMMIALCCKLFDEGFKTIFVLMHDIKTLQKQNFQDRFALNENFRVSPILAEEFLHTDPKTRDKRNWLIFGRKNSAQLEKLIHETRMLSNRIVLDDEADYATPDSNIGKRRKMDPTRINQHMKALVGNGYYIGVTATPGRLDLNNTLFNDAKKWVYCSPGAGYTGVNYFFPENQSEILNNYTLTLLPSDTSYKTHLQKAIYRFMARNAYQNIFVNHDGKKNYSMVIHTHYKIDYHRQDKETVNEIISTLQGGDRTKLEKLLENILNETKKIYKDSNQYEPIMEFIWKNARSSTQLFTLNSKNDINDNIIALKAPSTFTFVFGGNTLSRGVTFENMLSFYFSRSVKNALQQNTYVQIARHFGYRRDTGKQFELTIPEDIWEKWYACFSCHEMSLDFAKSGEPVWVKHKFTNPADSSSIDKENIVVDSDGTMSFAKFDLTDEIEKFLTDKEKNPLDKLIFINTKVGDKAFPRKVIDSIKINIEAYDPFKKIDFIVSKRKSGEFRDIINQKAMTDDERTEIRRARSLAPSTSEKNILDAYCYIVPYKNSYTKKVRIHFTKNKPIKYLKNLLHQKKN